MSALWRTSKDASGRFGDSSRHVPYRFDSAGAARALELIGKHKSVNAFKETESDRQPSKQRIEMAVVHMTKESYEQAMRERRAEEQRQH